MIETLTQEELIQEPIILQVDKGKKGYLVIGAGMMGQAVIHDLVRSLLFETITVLDQDGDHLLKLKQEFKEIEIFKGDIHNRSEMIDLMKSCKVAIGCVSYYENEYLSELAIEAKCHYIDLGGNMNVVKKQKELDNRAIEEGILILPNCGLAPGLANIIAAGAAKEFDTLDTMKLRVGGLPEYPQPPLNYQLVFSAEGLINEYMGKSEIIKDGEWTLVDSMTGLETIDPFPFKHHLPDNRLEAFHTSGGTSWLPYIFNQHINELDYKTIRYHGHCKEMNELFEKYPDRDELSEKLTPMILHKGPDVTLVRIEVTGKVNGKKRKIKYECLDYATRRLSSMMRMTAIPTSIIAQKIMKNEITLNRKIGITQNNFEQESLSGVYTPEEVNIDLEDFLEKLEQRDIIFKKIVEEG